MSLIPNRLRRVYRVGAAGLSCAKGQYRRPAVSPARVIRNGVKARDVVQPDVSLMSPIGPISGRRSR